MATTFNPLMPPTGASGLGSFDLGPVSGQPSMQLPGAPEMMDFDAAGGGGGKNILGMGYQNFSALAATLAGALAPNKYAYGKKVPSWQEKLAASMAQISQGQLMAKALAAGGGGAGAGMNPMLMQMMLGRQ